MIVEDEEDILTLYSDYLSKMGYHVIGRYTRGNNIKTDLERHSPDVFLINSIAWEENRNRGSHRNFEYLSVSADIIHNCGLPST
jgi:hypothetical protein